MNGSARVGQSSSTLGAGCDEDSIEKSAPLSFQVMIRRNRATRGRLKRTPVRSDQVRDGASSLESGGECGHGCTVRTVRNEDGNSTRLDGGSIWNVGLG